jgi:hypothetical protein
MIERVPMVDPDDGKSQHRNCILLGEMFQVGLRRPSSGVKQIAKERPCQGAIGGKTLLLLL